MRRVSLLSVLFCAHAALAQVPEQRPYVYYTDALFGNPAGLTTPSSLTVYAHAGYFPDPVACAIDMQTRIESQINSGVTDPDHLCITVVYFGMPESGEVKFLDSADAVDVEHTVGWVGQPPDNAAELIRHQPWMKNTNSPSTGGIPTCKDWMQKFLNKYDELDYHNTHDNPGARRPLPIPARFHFDSEFDVYPEMPSFNGTRLMRAIARDSRWSTMPVPGSGGLTMDQLFVAAKNYYGWTGVTSLDDAFFEPVPDDQGPNRPYTQWYRTVCQLAADGAMREAAYDVIHANVSPAGAWTNVKCTNWGVANSDGQLDTFGWHAGAVNPVTLYYDPATQCTRGFTDENDEGTYHDLYTQRGHSSVWLNESGVNSGDLEAPYVYRYPSNYADTHHRDFYLNDPATSTWPQVTIMNASLYNNRRWVESILNSPSGDPQKLVPWLNIPGNQISADGNVRYTDEELRNPLAMLRAKKVQEVILFSYNPQNPIGYTFDMPTMINQVYDPQLLASKVATGLEASSTVPVLDRLRFTLRDNTVDISDRRANECLLVSSQPISDMPTVEVQFTFSGMTQIDPFQINLEMGVAVTSDDAGGIAGTLWMYQGNDWVPLAVSDFGPSDPRFGFFAPLAGDGWRDTRRAFGPYGRDASQDQMRLKVVLQRSTSAQPFTASFDLVQVIGVPGTGSLLPGDPQGADYNYSGQVNAADVLAFFQGLTAGSPAADFNQDGVVNALDLNAFLNAMP